MNEEEQEKGGETDWTGELAVEAAVQGGFCCLLSLLNAFVLFLIPVSALLMLNR